MIEHGPLLERLLAGEFICQIRDEDAYRHLSQESTRAELNQYLLILNRRIVQSDSGSVFYLGFVELNKAARESLTKQFNETVQSLLPLLEWLQLVQEVMGQDRALTAGDTLKMQEFVLRSEDNQSLRLRVSQLAAMPFFNSHSEALDGQIKLIFRRLKEHGYLLQPHSERQYYIVTGKIDYLIEIIDFIRHEEHLPLEERVHQEDLL